MSRPAVGIVNQIGVEAGYGAGGTAGKKLTSLGFDFSPEARIRVFRRPGNKFPSAAAKQREWSVGTYDGILDFNQIVYPLRGMFGGSAPVAIPMTGAYMWGIAPNTAAADARNSFILQTGDASAAEEVTGAVFGSYTLTLGTETVDVSGDIIGGAIDEGATLDPVTDEIDEAPASVSDLDWFIDPTYAGIGVTKWADVLDGSLTIPMVVSPVFVQNSSYRSIRYLVEVALEDIRLTVRAINNAQTRAILAAMKVDSLPFRFIQALIVGDNIGAGADFTYKNNLAVKYESDRNINNAQGTYAKEINFRVMHNETMGRALEWTIINKIAAL